MRACEEATGLSLPRVNPRTWDVRERKKTTSHIGVALDPITLFLTLWPYAARASNFQVEVKNQ